MSFFTVEMIEYLLLCFATGIIGAFIISFPTYKERNYFKTNWKVILSAGIYSLFLSELCAMIIYAIIPKLMIEPPYPIGFIIGLITGYLCVNPSKDKKNNVLGVVDIVLGLFGLKRANKNNESNSKK